jgi:ABC-type transporter Mla maintaining outer membrane lipid asymmetry permease subunit MlaE
MITWVIPTILISLIMFKVDAPLTQAQNIGFAALLISACVTYIVGIQLALKDKSK